MPIQFSCACGRQLNAPDGAAGRRARCPNCGMICSVPAPAPSSNPYEYDLAPAAPTPPRPHRTVRAAAIPTLAMPAAALAPRITYTYLILLLAFLPLIIYTFIPRVDIDEHFAQTFAAHPELPTLPDQVVAVAHRAENGDASEDDIFGVLPADRFAGALFARKSELHWALALGAAVLWLGLILAVFPAARRFGGSVLLAAIFTATVGVLLLLGFQFAAAYVPLGSGLHFGRLGIVLLIIKLIGYSYAMADGDHGFILSFLGFTCGVGLCEEITKALPMLWRVKGPGAGPRWDELLVIGLASGVGFGIAEGIMYSGRYYNGIEGGGMYAVRFISCVVLHAFWAGAVAVTLYNHQDWLEGADNNWTYCFNVARIVLIPMCLHGMYDTLLKQDHDGWALLVAAATFAWFAFQVERMKRAEPAGGAALAAA